MTQLALTFLTGPAATGIGFTAVMSALVEEFAELSETVRTLERGFERSDFLIELLSIDYDETVASGACEVRLLAKASDRALLLLAALRAGNAQLRPIGIEYGHLDRSDVGCGTDEESVSRSAGGIPSTDDAREVGQ